MIAGGRFCAHCGSPQPSAPVISIAESTPRLFGWLDSPIFVYALAAIFGGLLLFWFRGKVLKSESDDARIEQFERDLDDGVLAIPSNFESECGRAQGSSSNEKGMGLMYKDEHLAVVFSLGSRRPIFLYADDVDVPDVHFNQISANSVAQMLNCDPAKLPTAQRK